MKLHTGVSLQTKENKGSEAEEGVHCWVNCSALIGTERADRLTVGMVPALASSASFPKARVPGSTHSLSQNPTARIRRLVGSLCDSVTTFGEPQRELSLCRKDGDNLGSMEHLLCASNGLVTITYSIPLNLHCDLLNSLFGAYL